MKSFNSHEIFLAYLNNYISYEKAMEYLDAIINDRSKPILVCILGESDSS